MTEPGTVTTLQVPTWGRQGAQGAAIVTSRQRGVPASWIESKNEVAMSCAC
jgi:hypothetical protein